MKNLSLKIFAVLLVSFFALLLAANIYVSIINLF